MTHHKELDIVIILLHDTHKKVLLQKRTDDAPYMPGQWAFFGGGVNDGESLLAALYRESIEEIDYTPVAPELLGEISFLHPNGPARLHIFHELFVGDKMALTLQEGQDWGWFTHSEIQQLNMNSREEEILKLLFELIK